MQQPNTRSTMRERVGYYAIGLTIGFLMLGLIWQARSASRSAPGPQDPAAKAAPLAVPVAPTTGAVLPGR